MWTHTPVPAYIYIVLPLGALKSQPGVHIVSRCCFISSTAPVIIFGHVYIYICVCFYLFIDLFGCLFFVYLIERERETEVHFNRLKLFCWCFLHVQRTPCQNSIRQF